MRISTIDLGYRWISKALHVTPVQPFRVTSTLGPGMSTLEQGRSTRKTYTRAYAPEPTLPGHLTFALKYEGVDLDFLTRVFSMRRARFPARMGDARTHQRLRKARRLPLRVAH